jgi:hypothetical protein
MWCVESEVITNQVNNNKRPSTKGARGVDMEIKLKKNKQS